MYCGIQEDYDENNGVVDVMVSFLLFLALFFSRSTQSQLIALSIAPGAELRRLLPAALLR